MTIPAPDHKRYFIEKLGLSERLMERCLGEALSAGGDERCSAAASGGERCSTDRRGGQK
jgi:hypothetical protein